MKKGFFLAAVLLCLFTAKSFAQDDKAFSEGSSTISAGYGLGNIWKSVFNLMGSFSGGSYKTSATGPFTVVYEYGISERWSAGISLGYSEVKSTYTDPYDASGNYKQSMTSIGALARFNYHFGHSEKFDPYVGGGLGYYKFKYKYSGTNGDDPYNGVFAFPTALGISAQLGAKYYFASNIGAFAEVGYVAGSIFQLGLTAKF